MFSLFSSVSRAKNASLRTAPKGHESAVREVVCTSAWVARDRRVPRASPALSSRRFHEIEGYDLEDHGDFGGSSIYP